MSALKHKPIKSKHLAIVQTLDELHKDKMSKLCSNFDKLEYISKTGDLLMNYYNQVAGSYYNTGTLDSSNTDTDSDDDDIESIIENSDDDCEEDENKKSCSDALKKLHEMSQKAKKVKKQIKKRRPTVNPGHTRSIFSFMEKENENEQVDENKIPEKEKQNEQKNLSRAMLFDQYRMLIDKSYACTKVKNSKVVMCSQCNEEKILDQEEGSYICKICGESECIIIENETCGHKDPTTDKQKYPYKRMNHLKEKLNQFQSKETADVPSCVYEKVFSELRKKRIRPQDVSSSDIRKILKTNRLNIYYEHIQQIYCKVTGCQPMTLTREIEEKIISMFQAMQGPFRIHCPKDRDNFLNYSYVLNKLFRMIGLEKYSKYFGLLKSKEKLRGQDAIWVKICKDLNWKYHSSF
jgi:hypothetical protein